MTGDIQRSSAPLNAPSEDLGKLRSAVEQVHQQLDLTDDFNHAWHDALSATRASMAELLARRGLSTEPRAAMSTSARARNDLLTAALQARLDLLRRGRASSSQPMVDEDSRIEG